MSETFPIVEHFPYLGIFLLLILGTLGCPFPEDVILMLCGFLISQDLIQPIPIFLAIYPTLLLTDAILCWSGRRYGRKVVEHPKFQEILSQRRLRKIETKFDKWGAWAIFVGRWVPGLRAQLFLVSGILRMPIVKFLVADGVSALIAIGSMGGIRYFGGERTQVLRQHLTGICSIVSIFIVLFTLIGSGVLHARRKGVSHLNAVGISEPFSGEKP